MGPRLFPGSSLRAGDAIGARYRVESLVRGSRASACFAGIDTKSGAAVTIEIVMGASEEADTVGVRFLASARRAATLDSPHVARVVDAGVTPDGHPYVVSEAVRERTLAAALDLRGSLATADAVDIALDVCDALADAHARGLLHGELSIDVIHLAFERSRPKNVRLAGIGTTLALLPLRGTDEMTLRAPEQLHEGGAIDTRTDVWALGVVLFAMLAGASPFAGDSPSGFSLSLALDEPAQLAGVPDRLADAVDSCLSKTPALRPQTILDLAEELAPFASDPRAAAARIASRSERPVDSSPTLVIGHYVALDDEKEAALTDADATAPRSAIAVAAIRAEGAVDVEPAVHDVAPTETAPMRPPASIPPPAVARTLPPPPPRISREMPTVLTRTPAGARRWRAAGLVGASACLVLGVVIGAQSMRASSPVEAAFVPPTEATELPAAPAASEPPGEPEPEPAIAIAIAIVAATALPDSPVPPPAAAAATTAAATAQPAAYAPKAAAPPRAVVRAPEATPKPEPKASDDDLRRFLDDRR